MTAQKNCYERPSCEYPLCKNLSYRPTFGKIVFLHVRRPFGMWKFDFHDFWPGTCWWLASALKLKKHLTKFNVIYQSLLGKYWYAWADPDSHVISPLLLMICKFPSGSKERMLWPSSVSKDTSEVSVAHGATVLASSQYKTKFPSCCILRWASVELVQPASELQMLLFLEWSNGRPPIVGY